MLWAPIASRLALSRGPVYAFDLRGHGKSEKPESGYGWDALAHDIELALEHLRLTGVCLIGHSLGGSLTLLLAAERPDLIERCIMIDPVIRKPGMLEDDVPAPGVPTVEVALVRRASWPAADAARSFLVARQPYASWQTDVLDLFIRHGIDVDLDGTARLACPPRIEAQIYVARRSFDPWRHLPRIRCPSLLIYGTDPRPDVLATPAEVTRAIPGARMVRLQGGHFLPFENPDGVLEAISAFLATSHRNGRAGSN